MKALISIVVPTLDERAAVEPTLPRLREPEVLEVIVVDGGSADGTAEVARETADRVIESPTGRARQMNLGARAARGEVLFFLHADTEVPDGFAAAIVRALEDPRVVGGRFDVALDAPGLGYRLVESGINLRSRWSRLFTGDQGLFIRRRIFDELGGFPDLPIFEDLALSRAMKGRGRIACLRARLRTSARRWQRHGAVRTVLLMWGLRALYAIGVSPRRLARLYPHVR